MPSRLRCLALSIFALSAGCAEAPGEPDDFRTQAFSTSPIEPNHEQITSDALGFLRHDVLALLIVGDTSTDLQFALDNASHFDDCNFSGGSALVASRQAEAVMALAPESPDEARAIVAFGRSLHGLQDFYAHSNWVELGADTLVDSTLTAFPTLTPYEELAASGIVVVQGAPPAATSVSSDDQASYPQNARVRVDGAAGPLGLVSGTVDYEPGDDCPEGASLTHEQLNKDQSTDTERAVQHQTAMRLATLQTRHEWCRLNALASEAWGEAGSRRLAHWVADPEGAPDCGVE